MMNRKIIFAGFFLVIFFLQCTSKNDEIVMTVNGPLSSKKMGTTLVHEHILVDFAGADSIDDEDWNQSEVTKVALPFLRQIKKQGCMTFLECTPAYLGRDPLLLRALSRSSGLNIITNTGYYGAGNNKYIPRFAFDETADQLSSRWTDEWENGIEGTNIRPGFIKIGVGSDSLSDFHKKLVLAAALTHLKTGLTIASHTGLSVPAFEQIEILREAGVDARAFVWVHAQNEKDITTHVKAAKMGAWVSFDGLDDGNIEDYIRLLSNMKENNLIDKTLISHDAGWYHPREKDGGKYRGYTTLFEKFLPILRKKNFSEDEINRLLIVNPADAYTVRVRKTQ